MRTCVTKEFTFHAAHRDEAAPEGDQCGRLHGHTYKVEVHVTGKMDSVRGISIHGDLIKQVYREQIEPFVEHQFLNETLRFNATMENVAIWLRDIFEAYLSGLTKDVRDVYVTLWETPTMHCTVKNKDTVRN